MSGRSPTLDSPQSTRHVWERRDVVRHYAEQDQLQAPERVVLEALEPMLSSMAMLDLGVGGGRTTAHFAPRAGKYVGVDFSSTMIDACIRRFGAHDPARQFTVGDARSMPMFPDRSFDFVLFSYNGIDYVTQPERLAILAEVRRVTREHGCFLFSTHNLNSDVERRFATRDRRSVVGWLKQGCRRLYFRAINPGLAHLRRRHPAVMINDGAHRFAFRTRYTKPEAQVAELRQVGFDDVTVMDMTGALVEPPGLRAVADPWLHYLCR